MKPLRESKPALAVLCLVLAVNAAALWPELSISRADLNDNVFHFALIERIVQAVEHGQNPLDLWSPEWSLGYPVLRTYQPLAHWLVAAVYFALGKAVPLMTVFVWIRFLSVALLPLSFFWVARRLTLSPIAAAAAAVLAPMISTNFLYGIEYNSFTWAGSGLFPQAVATHLLLIAIGSAWPALREGRRLTLAGVIVGLTALAHLIYGYVAALSICLMAFLPDTAISRAIRLRRMLWIGVTAALLTCFQLLPLLLDRGVINHSRWEAVWKWDSFGALTVLEWLVKGELLDYGRLPILTLLAVGGVVLWFRKEREREPAGVHLFIVLAAALWILLFFGRPFWGPLLAMVGVARDMHLHRVIAGVQVFGVLLAAIGLAALWRELERRWRAIGATVAVLVVLYPMVRDRAHTLSNDALWGRKSLAANEAAQRDVANVLDQLRLRGGRTYSGLAAGWGGKFKIGDVPFYAFFSTAQIPAVAFLYHSMALTSDITVRFNELDPAHYRLFNVRSVVAPGDGSVALPLFVIPRIQFGNFRVFDAPGVGYFDVVDVFASVGVTRDNLYDVNDRWLQSRWPGARNHLLLDMGAGAPSGMTRLRADGPLSEPPPLPPAGQVGGEQQDGQVYRAEMDVVRPAYALFKMTWHRNWKAYVDGAAAQTVMLTPGFTGVPVTPGHHRIEMRYETEEWKAPLGLAAILLIGLIGIVESRGVRARMEAWRVPAFANVELRRRAAIAAGLMLLALPVCIPLLTSNLIHGHDAYCYFPRVEELQENLQHGILLPRWAPDLGSGAGQPLFLMHPPSFYWLAELCHLAGFSFVTAVNLACVLIVIVSAFAMWALGRLYFGEWGAWLAAAAYLYVPYFATDLFVRSALEEFASFALFPLALYGFGAFARTGRVRSLVLGALAYAAISFSHMPSALTFTPLLIAFLALTGWTAGSRRVWIGYGAGFALGAAVTACIWLPAAMERQYVMFERAISGSANYAIHFVYPQQLIYSAWGYGYSVAGPNDGMSFSAGWSHLLLAAVIGVWIWRRREGDAAQRRLVAFFGVAGLLLCVLMTEDSDLVWQVVKPLQFVQLPWRLLSGVAICEAVLLGALGAAISRLPRWRCAAFTAALALLIVPNLPHLHAGSTDVVDALFWTPAELARTGFETTTLGELTPRWMMTRPPYDQRHAAVAVGTAQLRETERTPFRWRGEVIAQTPSTIQMRIAYFPGWTVRMDGQPLAARPSIPWGLLTFETPAGTHGVEVEWENTPPRIAGNAISLVALALLLMGFVWPARKRNAGEV
jgi:uncharacterized membrane protein